MAEQVSPEVPDGWAQDRDAKRRAWQSLTPTQRWEWLVGALDLAAATGALAADRRRRDAAAAAWAEGAEEPTP